MRDLDDAVVLVTGASRGLGRHVALACQRRGAVVALAARSRQDLQAVQAEVVRAGGRAEVFAVDLADPHQRDRLVDEVQAALGRVDVLVNNAGLEIAARYQEADPADLERVVTVNLTVPMVLTRQVLPGMLQRGRGHIVNMASVAGKTAVPYEVAYSATKAGLIAFTHSLRTELEGTPVGLSAICPGFVAGDGMYARMQEQGVRAPFYVGSTTTDKVCDAVMKAITQDRAEVIVNSMPVEPLASLGRLFPKVQSRLSSMVGATDAFRRAADLEHRR